MFTHDKLKESDNNNYMNILRVDGIMSKRIDTTGVATKLEKQQSLILYKQSFPDPEDRIREYLIRIRRGGI